MTDKEAIRTLQDNIDTWTDCPCPEHDSLQGDIVEIPIDNNDIIAFSVGIEAIKQRNILDKIRAEIENSMKWGYATGDDHYADGLKRSLAIIDEYKESED